MATSQFPSATTVTVDATGALNGDGTSLNPLAVAVDGVTIEVNASNELEVLSGGNPFDQDLNTTDVVLFAGLSLVLAGEAGEYTFDPDGMHVELDLPEDDVVFSVKNVAEDASANGILFRLSTVGDNNTGSAALTLRVHEGGMNEVSSTLELNTNGVVLWSGLPTSDPGVEGAVYTIGGSGALLLSAGP